MIKLLVCAVLLALSGAACADLGGEMVAMYASGADASALAESTDPREAGLAEWLLANATVYRTPDISRLHLARAAILLDTAEPILTYARTFLFDDDDRREVLPLLILASQMRDGKWSFERLGLYGPSEKSIGARQLELIRRTVATPYSAEWALWRGVEDES